LQSKDEVFQVHVRRIMSRVGGCDSIAELLERAAAYRNPLGKTDSLFECSVAALARYQEETTK
jgi:hypothetical protein